MTHLTPLDAAREAARSHVPSFDLRSRALTPVTVTGPDYRRAVSENLRRAWSATDAESAGAWLASAEASAGFRPDVRTVDDPWRPDVWRTVPDGTAERAEAFARSLVP